MIRTKEDMVWVQAMIDSGYSFGGMKTVAKDQLWYGDILYADSNGDMNYGDTNDRDFLRTHQCPQIQPGLQLCLLLQEH